MWNKFITTIFVFLAVTSVSAKCFQTKSSIIENQKRVESKEEICEHNYKNLKFFVSKRCAEKQNECLTLLREEVVEVKNAYSEIGSPGFKLCYAVNGSPQIFEFEKDKTVEESDRCIIGNGLWIEIPLLMKLKTIK